MATVSTASNIESILGSDAGLLQHECRTIPKDSLHLPGPDFVDRVYSITEVVAKVRRLADALEQDKPFRSQIAGERFGSPSAPSSP